MTREEEQMVRKLICAVRDGDKQGIDDSLLKLEAYISNIGPFGKLR